MALVKRRKMDLTDLADLENAVSAGETNTVNIEDTMNALIELAELFSEQDDALVELAELIGG